MPFRLLVLGVDPTQAGELCGHAIGAYEASGVDVVRAGLRDDGDGVPSVGADLVLVMADRIADLIERHRPHVVVVDGRGDAVRSAARRGFERGRQRLRLPGQRPLKLYSRAWAGLNPAVTTLISAPGNSAPELFVREYPAPWITGVLERDLFAGLRTQSRELEEQLAA